MVAEVKEKDPWETGTGMADDFDGTITEPFFGVDEKYNAEAVLFCATLVDENGEEITTLKYSVGDGWETNNDGTEIMHPSKAQINKGSRFGYFIDRLAKPATEKAPNDKRLESPAGMDKGLGMGAVLRERGTPFQAKTFEGLTFHWNLHKGQTLGKNDDGSPVVKDVLYPTKFLGAKGKAPALGAKASGAAAGSASPAPKVEQAASNGSAEIPPQILKKLTLLALQNDLKTFIQQAARDKEVITLPDEIVNHVLDGSAEGFHAKANA